LIKAIPILNTADGLKSYTNPQKQGSLKALIAQIYSFQMRFTKDETIEWKIRIFYQGQSCS
jgi:hypothetical protein